MVFGSKGCVILVLLVALISTSILIDARHRSATSATSTTSPPKTKTIKRTNAEDKVKLDVENELCSDENSCDEEQEYYEDFISLLSVKAPETLKMYVLAVNSISKALNKTKGGRDFMKKYKLPEHRPAESLVAMHKSDIQRECDVKMCTCPLDTYLCNESLVCPTISEKQNECAKKPECKPNCKLIIIPTNSTGPRSKSQRTVKLSKPKSIFDEMIDALGVEVNKLVNQIVPAAFQAHSLEPVCEAIEEDGRCVKGSAGSKRSWICWISGCVDDELRLDHNAVMAKLEIEKGALDLEREKIKLEHDRGMEELAAKERERMRQVELEDRKAELEMVKIAAGQSIDVKDASSSSTAKPTADQESTTKKPKSKTTMEPISSTEKPNGQTTHALDPKTIYVMREAFKILKNMPDVFAKSIKCPCKKEICEANQKLWRCVNICPNNHGCDTYKCECPYETSASKTTPKP